VCVSSLLIHSIPAARRLSLSKKKREEGSPQSGRVPSLNLASTERQRRRKKKKGKGGDVMGVEIFRSSLLCEFGAGEGEEKGIPEGGRRDRDRRVSRSIFSSIHSRERAPTTERCRAVTKLQIEREKKRGKRRGGLRSETRSASARQHATWKRDEKNREEVLKKKGETECCSTSSPPSSPAPD